jgi:hypothetical protein
MSSYNTPYGNFGSNMEGYGAIGSVSGQHYGQPLGTPYGDSQWWRWLTTPWTIVGLTSQATAQATEAWMQDGGTSAYQAAVDTVATGVSAATTAAATAWTAPAAIYEAGRDYLTTAQTDTFAALAIAAKAEIDALRAGRPAVSIGNATHGVMLSPPTYATGTAAFYRIAYWLAFGGRLALGAGDRAGASRLGDMATRAFDQGSARVAQGWAASIAGIGRGGLAGAGWSTLTARRALRRAGQNDTAATLSAVNVAAISAFYSRAIVVGAVATAVVATGAATAYGVHRRRKRRGPQRVKGTGKAGTPRKNGRGPRRSGKARLTADQKARRIRGVGMILAGAVLASPLDETIVAAATAGLGIPFVPVQGAATLTGGAVLAASGLYLVTTARKRGQSR